MKTTTQLYIFLLSISFASQSIAQQAIDFTFYDTDGQSHTLYADYLNQGKTVLVDFFFVDCPPCNTFAPHLQDVYEDWGEGTEDVEFFSLSNKNWDTNLSVKQYENLHGATNPGAGEDGGAYDIFNDYLNGGYGSFFGTPFFMVIAPDGDVTWNVNGSGTQGKIDAINAAIAATGATGGNVVVDPPAEPEPVEVYVSVKDTKNNTVPSVTYTLTSTEANAPSYPILLDNQGKFSFQYFSQEFPDIQNPILRITKEGDWLNGVFTTDILFIQRHLLGIQVFTQDYQTIAADVSNDDKITSYDMNLIRKTILQKIDSFPSGVSWKFFPAEIEIDTTPGTIQTFNVQAIKMGDLNRH